MDNIYDFDEKKCIELNFTKKHYSQFEDIKLSYKWNMSAYNAGAGNFDIVKNNKRLSVVPFLYDYFNENNHILPYEELVQISAKDKWEAGPFSRPSSRSPSKLFSNKQRLEGKIRNFWTGWLREIGLGMSIFKYDPRAVLWYDSFADLKKGIDLFYKRYSDERILKIAVFHEGEDSRKHIKDKKQHKQGSDVFNVVAKQNKMSELHLVSDKDALDLVCGLYKLKNIMSCAI